MVGRKNIYIYLALAAGMGLVFIAAILGELSLFASLFLLICLVCLPLSKKYSFELFLLLLLIRPAIDSVGTRLIFETINFPINYNGVVAFLMIFLAGLLVVKDKARLKRMPGLRPVTVFLAFSALSIFWSLSFSSSISELIRILSIFSAYFAAFLLVKDKKKLKKLNLAIIASAIVPMSVALYQYVSGTGETIFGEFFIRTKGTFFYPNNLAFFLVFIVGMLLVRFSLSKEKISRGIYGLLIGLCLIVLLSTYTRGAWFGVMIVLGVYGLIKHRKILLVGILILLVAYLLVPTIQERMSDIIRLEPFSSIVWRFRLWGNMLGDFIKRPIHGYGIGAFQVLSGRSQGLNMLPAPEAHNDYLRIMIEIGIVGLISYLAFIFRVLIFQLKTFLKAKDKFLKNVSFVSVIIFGTFILMAFGDNVLRGTAVQWILFGYLGGVVGLARTQAKEK